MDESTDFGQRKMVIVILTVAVACYCGCGCELDRSTDSEQRLVVMTYNVQNLFDVYVTGNEYPEYTPEGGWTARDYQNRLERTARAITQGHGMVPDIVVFQEIEHEGVLEDLVRDKLSQRGFYWFAATADPDSAIQTGVASRYPMEHIRVHGVDGMRSVLEVRIDTGREPLVVLAVHAKSRREGVEETEWQRIELAEALTGITASIFREDPYVPVVIAGDFNESADAFNREGSEYRTALVPADAAAADMYGAQGSLVVTGGTPAIGRWHSWWLDREALLLAHAQGSYWYRGVWETFDQILLSPALFDGIGWEFISGQVGGASMLYDDGGHPAAWNAGTGEGYSDHLPVQTVLAYR